MIKESVSNKLFNAFNIFLMLLVCAVMLFPYVNVLAYALNDGLDAARGGIWIFPRVFTLDNFKVLVKNKEIINSLFVSVSRVVLGTSFALIIQFSCAYAFSKKNLPFKQAILVFLMIPMYFGGGIIPVYLLYAKMNLLNNFLVYILPVSFSLYNMVIIRTYLYSIPESLEESARIDGANEIIILFRIILPLSLPILATVGLWSAVSHWNDWTTTLYFVTNSRIYTLQYILMQVLKESDRIAKLVQEAIESGNEGMVGTLQRAATPESVKAAQIILTSLPIVMVYPFLQKYFIKGVSLGAVKE